MKYAKVEWMITGSVIIPITDESYEITGADLEGNQVTLLDAENAVYDIDGETLVNESWPTVRVEATGKTKVIEFNGKRKAYDYFDIAGKSADTL